MSLPHIRTLLLTGGIALVAAGVQAAPSPAKPAPKPAVRPAAAKTPSGPAQSPDQVVQAFLKAQQEGDDDKAYNYLSSAAKQRFTLDKWQQQGSQVRLTFAAINLLVGDTLLVGGASNAQNKVASTNVKGNEATVKVTHLVPINNTLHLVKENGKWVIDIQRSLNIDSTKKPTPAPVSQTPPAPATPSPPVPADYTQLCQSNLRQIATAFRVYALDHDGKLPDASKWTDEMLPYLSSPSVLKCSPDTPAESSFAMNAALSGAKLTDINDPRDRVLLYETTTTAKNVSGSGSTQPSEAPRAKGYLVMNANGDVVFRATKPEVR